MRIYLEFFELTESAEQDFIRIDITEWSREDIDLAIQLMREHAQTYEYYILQVHYCGHEEGLPCSVSIIELLTPTEEEQELLINTTRS
jgi:predicted alpha/beta hydrolase